MSLETKKSDTHEERYFHIKPNDVWEAMFSENYTDVYFPCQAATVFYRKEQSGWHGAIALCSWVDNFCRATGRKVARRKYFIAKEAGNLENCPSIRGETPTYGDALSLFMSYCEGR